MEAFDPEMFPQTCTVTPPTIGEDASAGPTEAFPAGAPELPCRVRYTRTTPFSGDLGDRSVTMANVAFPADPGVQINWQVAVADGPRLRALGPARARDGSGALFVLACEADD